MSWQHGREGGPLGPYSNVSAVTPSDTVDLPDGLCQSIYATVAGNVNVDLVSGKTIVVAIGAGYTNKLDLLVRRVRSTSTTATGIVALYV